MTTVLSKLTRRALRLGQWCPGYLPLARRARAGSLAILMYHGVTERPLEPFNWSQIDQDTFAEQIEFLAQHYTILPLREALDRQERGAPLPAAPAVVTFDDGFRSVRTQAFPILKKHGVPATVFLVSGQVGTGQPAWPEQLYHTVANTDCTQVTFAGREWPLGTNAERAATYRALAGRLKALDTDEKDAKLSALLQDLAGPIPIPADSHLATLDWSEINELARGGLVDFGSHTHTHPILARCTPARQEQELRVSRDIIRERLGRCDLFAYPNGTRADFTPLTQRLLAELGYRCGLSTVAGLNRAHTDRFAMRRVNVGADADLGEFKLLMVGL